MDLTLDVGEVTTDEIAELSAENLVGVWLQKEKKNINFFIHSTIFYKTVVLNIKLKYSIVKETACKIIFCQVYTRVG